MRVGMKLRISNWLILFPAMLVLAGCMAHRPDGVLPPRKMEKVLYDYHLAQAVANGLPYDERYKAEFMRNFEFEKHGVTKEEFEASLVWYTRNPRELHKIYERLYETADKDRDAAAARLEMLEKKSYRVMSGDSVELWYLRHAQIITQSPYMNPMQFRINVDSTFYHSDSLIWTVGTTFFDNGLDSIRPYAYLSLSLVYGDSISTVDTLIDETSLSRLVLQCDERKIPNDVRGAVTYINESSVNEACLLLSDISLLRLHQKAAAAADSIASDSIPSPEL